MLNEDAFEPFDSDDYISELKIDGFWSLPTSNGHATWSHATTNTFLSEREGLHSGRLGQVPQFAGGYFREDAY